MSARLQYVNPLETVSVLVSRAGREAHSLSLPQLQALTRASRVAVSMEPRGGSPAGAPTGPVMFVADRIKKT